MVLGLPARHPRVVRFCGLRPLVSACLVLAVAVAVLALRSAQASKARPSALHVGGVIGKRRGGGREARRLASRDVRLHSLASRLCSQAHKSKPEGDRVEEGVCNGTLTLKQAETLELA